MVIFFAFVLFFFKVVTFSIAVLFIKKVTSFFNKFLSFGSALSSSFIIRNSGGTKG